MFTPDPTGLVAEYLFETQSVGGVVRNTASPGTFDGQIIHDSVAHPLKASADVPPGFIGCTSLDYNVLRRLSGPAEATQGFAQYVEVRDFPDLTELTVEAWVKVDYRKSNIAFTDPPEGTYPDGAVGFGACPQPVCKANSWYLFLSTLQTDRNLILTTIPDNVTQGLPKSADGTSGSGGVVGADIVHAGQWTHIAATVKQTGPNEFTMHTYLNGIQSHIQSVTDFDGDVHNIPNVTDNAISPSPGRSLRLGQFRQIQPNLDYQYSGKLAGVRIYSRALSAAEIGTDLRHDICARGKDKETKLPVQYGVKFVCGPSSGGPVAPGSYFTAINIHNPTDRNVRFRKKVAVALPGERTGHVTGFTYNKLGPCEALEIDCADIYHQAGLPEGCFLKGFVVIQSHVELDVVAVYTAAGADELVETLDINHVVPRVMEPEETPDRRMLPDLVPLPAFPPPPANAPAQLPQNFCFSTVNGQVANALRIVVRNQGDAGAPASVTEVVIENNPPIQVPTPAIGAGQEVSLDVMIPDGCFTSEMACTFEITVNATGAFSESNSSNNIVSGFCPGIVS